MKPLLAALVLSSLSAVPAEGSELEPGFAGVVETGRQYDLPSAAAGRTYRLYIYVPPVPAPPEGYPIVYLLDGNLQFPVAAATASMRAWTNEVPHAVIVGIGYPAASRDEVVRARWSDLSLPAPLDVLPSGAQALRPELGGLDAFLRFIDEEAKPFVEKRVAVNRTCQTFVGHSLGGLAVLRALFTRPGMFHSYAALSPAIWWNGRAVLRDEPAFLSEIQDGHPRVRLLLTAGGLEEDTTPWLSNPEIVRRLTNNRQVRNIVELAERLERHESGTFQITSYVFPDETHTSVIPTSISKALAFGLACTTE